MGIGLAERCCGSSMPSVSQRRKEEGTEEGEEDEREEEEEETGSGDGTIRAVEDSRDGKMEGSGGGTREGTRADEVTEGFEGVLMRGEEIGEEAVTVPSSDSGSVAVSEVEEVGVNRRRVVATPRIDSEVALSRQ